MAFELTMPKLSPTMEEGIIAKWHVSVGDKVEVGDLLLEVSTDKATVEHSAIDEGVVAEILVSEGGTATVNQPIAVFGEEGEKVEPYKKAAPEKLKMVPKKQEAVKKSTPTKSQQRVKASPLAKKIAEREGINLSTIQGTGPGGRIIKRDLSQKGSMREEEMSQIRKVIAKRLQHAKSTIPHYYLTQEINAGALFSLREQLKSDGQKVTFNDLVVRATALALKDHPGVNTGFDPEREVILSYGAVDICIAVTIPDGLITPIIKDADTKTVFELSVEAKSLSAKARAGKLHPEEFQGGSFTISNLGMYGLSQFAAVINPPQAAILAVGGISDQPVVEEGVVVAGKILKVTLSADHRVIDGAVGAEFLKSLKGLLENPALLLT